MAAVLAVFSATSVLLGLVFPYSLLSDTTLVVVSPISSFHLSLILLSIFFQSSRASRRIVYKTLPLELATSVFLFLTTELSAFTARSRLARICYTFIKYSDDNMDGFGTFPGIISTFAQACVQCGKGTKDAPLQRCGGCHRVCYCESSMFLTLGLGKSLLRLIECQAVRDLYWEIAIFD